MSTSFRTLTIAARDFCVGAARRAGFDLRDSLRGLRGGRDATIPAFIILTVTMTAGVVTFSVVDAVAIRPLPFDRPERLVSLSLPSPTAGNVLPATPQAYFGWLASTSSFTAIGAARLSAAVPLEANGTIEHANVTRVTANLFAVLGVRPAAGTLFGPQHERPGGPPSAILSHDLWIRRFNKSPESIGRRIAIAGATHEIIGVVPRDVAFPVTAGRSADIYLPYAVIPGDQSNNRCCLFVVGRLREGIALEQARADAERGSAVVLSLHDQVVGRAKVWLLLVLASIGFLLLIANVNVAISFLARAIVRLPDFATRASLGASRFRLTVGLMLEGLIISVGSAITAIGLSGLSLTAVKAVLPPELPRLGAIAVNSRVLLAAIVVAILCGMICSSAAAVLTWRRDLAQAVKSTHAQLIGNHARSRGLSALLVAHLALVSGLLVATALVIGTFIVVLRFDLGFNHRNLMVIGFQRSLANIPEHSRLAVAGTLRADLLRAVNAVEGVADAAVSLSASLPLSGSSSRYSIVVPGFGETSGADMLEANMVSPDYFRVMGMRLIRGRLFDASDRLGSPAVMVINDVAADRYFGETDPIGQVVVFREPTTIIGVLQGVRFDGPERDVRPAMYTPIAQQPLRKGDDLFFGSLIIRTDNDARTLTAAVRETVRAAIGQEPGYPQFVEDYFQRATTVRRFNASIMAAFGLVAAIVGALAVYGTMSFFVAQQRREISVRVALGATTSRVVGSALRHALVCAVIGVSVGLMATRAMSRLLTPFVFGVEPTDFVAYLSVGLAVIGIAGSAALAPAIRAARIDPAQALRHE